MRQGSARRRSRAGKFHGEMHAITPRGAPCPRGGFAQRLVCVEACEVARLAHLAHAVEPGLARLARREREQLRCIRFVEVGYPRTRLARFSTLTEAQAAAPTRAASRATSRSAGAECVTWPTTSSASCRISDLSDLCADGRSRDERPRFPDGSPELLALSLDCGHRERIGQVPPLGVAAFGHVDVRGRRDVRVCDGAAEPLDHRIGSRAISSGVTLSSTIWFTNELLAPFSSRRRTR